MAEAFIEFEIYGVLLRYYNEERIERIMSGKWKTIKQSNKSDGYKYFNIGNNKKVYVHRVIYKAHNLDWDITDNSTNNFIDHSNRVRNSNKIENLSVVTAQQNNFNRNAKGFYFDKQRNKYRADICRGSETIYLGHYDTPEEAHDAYLKAKPFYHN